MELLFEQAARGNYRPGRTQPVEYIVVHYTGNWSDTAKNNADYFARTVTGTSAHYFVDEEAVWQSVREEDTAWHCGSRSTPPAAMPIPSGWRCATAREACLRPSGTGRRPWCGG